MEITFILVSVVQSMAISLGVGCSTVAILSFFVAINDGQIDQSERKLMGLTYILLRIAMILILLSTAALAYISYQVIADSYFTTYSLAVWSLIAVLFINAILMTTHVMPSSVGPGLQAATWYTLGISVALPSSILFETPLLSFYVWYLSFVAVVVLAIYVYVTKMKERRAS